MRGAEPCEQDFPVEKLPELEILELALNSLQGGASQVLTGQPPVGLRFGVWGLGYGV